MSFHIKYPDDEIVGQQFGRLIVTGIAQPKKGMKHFKCQCFCGNKCVANKYLLLYGKKKSCGCLKDKTVYAKGQASHLWRGYKELPSRYWGRLKNGAKNRGIIFNITEEDAWLLFEKQNHQCAYTGDMLVFARCYAEQSSQTASLDRIDSAGPYSSTNVQWVHKTINSMKWDMTQEKFVKLCKRIIDQPPTDPSPCATLRSHPKNFSGHGNIGLRLWNQICRNANKRGIYVDYTIKEAWELFCNQNGLCALSKLPMILTYGKITASLDRVDNTKGYTTNNVQWVHRDINTKMRRDLTISELKEWCNKVVTYLDRAYRD